MPAPPAAPVAPAEEALPPVAVLDPSMRSSLPPMKLSMHVYNDDPARRFAILDGQRVTEGSQIGAAIVLEIRRDGVVLDVAGKRVLLPRP
jgi:general secretion pathway protein B